MQTPICEVCLKSDFLCKVCQNKLDNAEISKLDVDISRFLFNLSEKVKSLKDIKLKKVLDAGIMVIISGSGDGAKIVGKQGLVVKALAKEFKKPIRVVEEADNVRRFVQDLMSPITIMGINTLYTPHGEIYRVRVPSSQKNSLIIQPENFSNVILSLYNRKAEIIFEA